MSSATKALLDFIGEAEAKGNYNAYYGNAESDIPLEDMTLSQILEFQQELVKRTGSSVVGRYQIKDSTLRGLIKSGKLSKSAKFTPELQDRLGTMLLNQRGLQKYLDGDITGEEFGDRLSMEWAALPVITGKNAGNSYYQGVGDNKAGVSVDDVLGTLHTIKGGGREVGVASDVDIGRAPTPRQRPSSALATYLKVPLPRQRPSVSSSYERGSAPAVRTSEIDKMYAGIIGSESRDTGGALPTPTQPSQIPPSSLVQRIDRANTDAAQYNKQVQAQRSAGVPETRTLPGGTYVTADGRRVNQDRLVPASGVKTGLPAGVTMVPGISSWAQGFFKTPPANIGTTELTSRSVPTYSVDANGNPIIAKPASQTPQIVPAWGKTLDDIRREADNGRISGYRDIQEMQWRRTADPTGFSLGAPNRNAITGTIEPAVPGVAYETGPGIRPSSTGTTTSTTKTQYRITTQPNPAYEAWIKANPWSADDANDYARYSNPGGLDPYKPPAGLAPKAPPKTITVKTPYKVKVPTGGGGQPQVFAQPPKPQVFLGTATKNPYQVGKTYTTGQGEQMIAMPDGTFKNTKTGRISAGSSQGTPSGSTASGTPLTSIAADQRWAANYM